MFVRIDRDLVVNINNIFSYKISEDIESYKLQIWSPTGALIHSVFYMKNKPEQVNILIQFNDTMRERMVNPEIINEQVNTVEEPIRHINESINKEDVEVIE